MDLFTSKSMEDWGILRYFWWPYAKLVKHRDRLHTPLLGTFVRWIYTLMILAVAIVPFAILVRRIGFHVTFEGQTEDIIWYLGYLLDAFIGANLADAMHFSLDMVTTGFKEGLGHHHHHTYYPLASEHRMPYERDRHIEYEREPHHNEPP